MIKSWLFEFFFAPGEREKPSDVSPEVAAAHFAKYIKLWEMCEPLGYEGIFFSEHHFGRGYSPSPNLLIANMAMRTRTLRLGTLGMVLPYYDPWRVVEEIAMLDHLTHGRLEIGLASGIPNELKLIGMSYAEARERFDEALEVVDAALKAPVISHHGKYWNFDNLRIAPRPLQQPAPPMWTTVISVESAKKSARRDSKIFTSFQSVARVAEIFDAYRNEADRAGTAYGPDRLGLRRIVSIADSLEEAQAASQAAIDASQAAVGADPRAAMRLNLLDSPPAGARFEVSPDEFIAGTPKQVTEQVVEQCRATGAGHFSALLNRGTDNVARACELFAEHVIPALLKTNPGGAQGVARARQSAA